MSRKPKNLPFNGVKDAPPPRQETEIQADAEQLTKVAGDLQYKVFVYSEELKQVNGRLVALNNEAYRRRQMDATAAAEEKKAE